MNFILAEGVLDLVSTVTSGLRFRRELSMILRTGFNLRSASKNLERVQATYLATTFQTRNLKTGKDMVHNSIQPTHGNTSLQILRLTSRTSCVSYRCAVLD